MLSAAAIAAASVYAAASIPTTYSAARDYVQGRRAFDAGDFKTAERLQLEAYSLLPASRKIRIDLAQTLFADADPKKDPQALALVKGLKLTQEEWYKLSGVMPGEYRQQFDNAKGR